MPKRVLPLTAKQVEAARFEERPWKLTDGAGLYLHVKAGGKYWRLRYRYSGRAGELALGVYPTVTLAEARRSAQDARRLLAQGVDPAAVRRAEKAGRKAPAADSFESLAREWLETVHRSRVVPTHYGRNVRRLEVHVFPFVGAVPVGDLDAAQLLEVLRRVEKTGRVETAARVRTLASQVFRYAIAVGKATRDPAGDLRGLLVRPEVRHHPSLLEPKELGGLLRAIDTYGGQATTRGALLMLAYTAARPGEARYCRWEDIDLPGAVWRFTASKGGVEMLTPLSAPAVVVLRELEPVTGPADFVFPSLVGKGRPLSDATLTAALARLGYRGTMTAHGFRACFRTLVVQELRYQPHLAEVQLGHQSVRGPLGAAYDRSLYLDERREMLEGWGRYLVGLRDGDEAES